MGIMRALISISSDRGVSFKNCSSTYPFPYMSVTYLNGSISGTLSIASKSVLIVKFLSALQFSIIPSGSLFAIPMIGLIE